MLKVRYGVAQLPGAAQHGRWGLACWRVRHCSAAGWLGVSSRMELTVHENSSMHGRKGMGTHMLAGAGLQRGTPAGIFFGHLLAALHLHTKRLECTSDIKEMRWYRERNHVHGLPCWLRFKNNETCQASEGLDDVTGTWKTCHPASFATTCCLVSSCQLQQACSNGIAGIAQQRRAEVWLDACGTAISHAPQCLHCTRRREVQPGF